MTIVTTLAALALLADPSDKNWVEASKDDGITVYSREHEDSPVKEVKAIGLIDASVPEVWKAVRDYPNYSKTMPYTEESKVLGVEGGGKVTWFYSVVNAPLVDRRDYVIKLVDQSEWKEGKGFMKVTWSATTEKAPPEREDAIRVKINDGYWLLEPRDGGKKTFATYYLYTDPGGSVPKWLVNKANNTAVPNVFLAVRKVVADAHAAQADEHQR